MNKQRRKIGTTIAIVVAIAAGVSVSRHRAHGPASAAATAPTAAAGAGAVPDAAAPSQPAVDALMALPELQAWSAAIEKRSHGSAHGAVIAGDPSQQRIINDRTYQAYTFVESDPDAAHFWQGFYVTANGASILVEDATSGETMTVDAWRQKDHPLDRAQQALVAPPK